MERLASQLEIQSQITSLEIVKSYDRVVRDGRNYLFPPYHFVDLESEVPVTKEVSAQSFQGTCSEAPS